MGGFLSAGAFLSAYRPFLIAFAIMVVLVFALMLILQYARHTAEAELNTLFNRNASLYLERLENNRLLKLVFRRPVLLLYMLRGYLKTGDDSEIRKIIAQLDGMKLEPGDKVEYLQNRMSFFVSVGDTTEAKLSFEKLRGYLCSVHADEVDKYRAMIDEGKEIIRVYIDRDTSYIDELIEKAERTEHPVLRGVMYYRLAKLSHFKGDIAGRERYLSLAENTLKGTDYEEIIKEALKSPEILEIK